VVPGEARVEWQSMPEGRVSECPDNAGGSDAVQIRLRSSACLSYPSRSSCRGVSGKGA